MSNEDKGLAAAVKAMARLSIMVNQISPVQEKNLKLYPFVFFEDVKTAKIEYDLEGKNRKEVKEGEQPPENDFRVIYHLELDESANNHLEKRFDAIRSSVASLLWSDIQVEVHFNDRMVYKSQK